MKRKIYIILSLLGCLFLSNCNKTTTPKTGTIKISFRNVVGTQPILLDGTTYTNPFGEKYSITHLKYYISNICLINNTNKIVEKIFLSLRSDIRLFDFSLTNDNTDEFVRTINAALMLWKNFEKKLEIVYKEYDNPHRVWWTLQLNENNLTRFNRAGADELLSPQNTPILLLSLNIKSIAVSNVYVTIMCTLMGAYKFTNKLDFRLSDSPSLNKLENDFKVNGLIGVISDADFPEWE